MRSENPECDWPEDFSHENGNYTCHCGTCGKYFTGHKRRITCKVCANITEPSESGERKSPEEMKSEVFLLKKIDHKMLWLDNYDYKLDTCPTSIIASIMTEYASQETALAIQPLLERIKILEGEIKAMQGHADSEGWTEIHYPTLPYTGRYEVRDSDGNIFKCTYYDSDNEWGTDQHVVAWRELPQPPTKEKGE